MASQDARPGDYRIVVEPAAGRVTARLGGTLVADSARALVLRETRLPPVYYLPREDVRMDLAEPTELRTHCPFKGNASYWTLRAGGAVAENAMWAYEEPLPEAEPIRGHVAFHSSRLDGLWMEGPAAAGEAGGGPAEGPTEEPEAHVHGNPLVDWLLRRAWQAADVPGFVRELGHALRAAGIPVVRANLIVRTLHPQVMGTVHLWSLAADDVESVELRHDLSGEERFLASPFIPIFAGRGGVRRRLEGPDAQLDFPILRDLRDAGATDYAAMPLAFSDGQIHALTLATDAPGGFATSHLGHVHEVLPLVARLVEVHALQRTARTLLDTYLGRHTGTRVLEGKIRRGDGDRIPAVVWMADLRGSTALQRQLERTRYLELLNRFFDATAGAAIDAGGEVLKFIGDAVLAIFPVRDEAAEEQAPRRALGAARDALLRLERYNAACAPDEPRLHMALALHLGEVDYGNVGVPGRLDFTVTGPVVNEVSRIEELSKKLGTPVLASAEFAALAEDARADRALVSLGPRSLRGVERPLEVFTLTGLEVR